MYYRMTVSMRPHLPWGCSEQVGEYIRSLAVSMDNVVAIIRSCSSVLVFLLVLCNVFPVEQARWVVDNTCESTGGTGHEQTCGLSDSGAATESEDDSPQGMQDDFVASGVSVPDCGLSRFHASMNEIPLSPLLISQLLHPPTSLS